MKRFVSLALVIGTLFLLFSNLQQLNNQTYTPSGHFWRLDSLRGLDQIDSGQSPDIIAYYARLTPDALQLRIDFLDLSNFDPNLFFIEILDFTPYQLQLSSLSETQGFFWFINQSQNYISIQLPQTYKSFEFRFILKNQHQKIMDVTPKFSLYSKNPPPIYIQLQLKNTQLGYTPAQILRNWDGAHNGPFGERFGLSHLFAASRNYQIPITLTDFLTPENIRAVNLLSQEKYIQQIWASGLVKLCSLNFSPDDLYVLYTNYFEKMLITYDYPPAFHCNNVSPVNFSQSPIFNNNGLSTSVEQFLIHSYFQNPEETIALTDSFPDSPLSDFNRAPIIFDYLKNHPWLQFYSPNQPTTTVNQINYPSELMDNLAHELYSSTGPFQKDSVFHFYTMVHPQNYESLSPIIPNYIPEFYYQIEANRWAASPKNMIRCDVDINQDQENDCLISNQNYFLIYDLNGGYIPFIAAKNKNNSFFQITGSSSQLMFGLSPSIEWKTGNGVFADPSVIPGIISESHTSQRVEFISEDFSQIVISNGNNPEHKININLDESQITIEYLSPETNSTLQIPFICKYDSAPSTLEMVDLHQKSQTLNLACGENPMQLFITGRQLETKHYSILDLNTLLQNPENPDYQYPRAHYLPLGLSLTDIQFDSQLTLTFNIP